MKITFSIEFVGLGEQLLSARKAKGLSLGDVANITGKTAANFNYIEREDVKSVPWETLRSAADAVGVQLPKDEMWDLLHEVVYR